MKTKKGFTLIELLAVIVILAIIMVIAVPQILNVIEGSRRNAAMSSALLYVRAIEYNNKFANMGQSGYTRITSSDVSGINVNIKGEGPTSGSVTINEAGKVSSASLCIQGYTVNYDGSSATIGNKCDSSTPAVSPVAFATDSWETISANTTSSVYHVGDTKEVEIDMDDNGTPESYTVRIANNTTPAICGTSGYSQTACGFVVEFLDLVGTHNMNTENTSAGGWKESEMAVYLNSDFFNKLPSDLKSVIIPTYPIVSGSGNNQSSENITSSDTTKNKIYLFSVREVGFENNFDNKRNVEADTRILDYYSDSGNSKVKTWLNNGAKIWWLRTAHSNGTNTFFRVNANGTLDANGSSTGNFVSPAFRVGINQ